MDHGTDRTIKPARNLASNKDLTIVCILAISKVHIIKFAGNLVRVVVDRDLVGGHE